MGVDGYFMLALGVGTFAVSFGLWLRDRKKPEIIQTPEPMAAPNLTDVTQSPPAPVSPSVVVPAPIVTTSGDVPGTVSSGSMTSPIPPVPVVIQPVMPPAPGITGSKPVIPSLVRTPEA